MPLQCGRPGFDLWIGKIFWRRERLPTPVFWPGEFNRLYSPWGCKELETTEQLSLSCTLATKQQPQLRVYQKTSTLEEAFSLGLQLFQCLPWLKKEDPMSTMKSFCFRRNWIFLVYLTPHKTHGIEDIASNCRGRF